LTTQAGNGKVGLDIEVVVVVVVVVGVGRCVGVVMGKVGSTSETGKAADTAFVVVVGNEIVFGRMV